MAKLLPPLTAVDIGTNTLQAVTGSLHSNGTLSLVHDEEAITRLGEGVDRARALRPAAMDRTLRMLAGMVERARAVGTSVIHTVATSAVRDASNRESFLERVRAITGGPVRVITGDEEASLTFAAARYGTSLVAGTETLVFDIGGGSTELVAGRLDQTPSWSRSIDVGSVRGYEASFAIDPPTCSALAAFRAQLQAALPHELPRHEVLLGVAATVKTLANVAEHFEPGASSGGSILPRAIALRTIDRLVSLPRSQRSAIPGVDVGRADVIVAGACIVGMILAISDAPVLHLSGGGVRHGLLLTLLLHEG